VSRDVTWAHVFNIQEKITVHFHTQYALCILEGNAKILCADFSKPESLYTRQYEVFAVFC